MPRVFSHARAVARIALIVVASLFLVLVRALASPLRWVSGDLDRRALEALMRAYGALVSRIAGLQCRVIGDPPSAPVVLASNHLSYLDILVLMRVWTGVFVAKSEVGSWPGFGSLARIAGTVFVDRARKRDLLRVIEVMSTRLRNGGSVLFFPEGTSSPGAEVLSFRSSLFEAAMRSGAPVAAAALHYEVIGADDLAADAVCWWGGMTFPDHAYRMLGLPAVRATLCFGTKRLRAGDRKTLSRSTREEVMALFSSTQCDAHGTTHTDLASISR